MTSIMIYHIKSKYTAVGRKEIVMFFYLYMIDIVMEFVVISGVVPVASDVYPVLQFFLYLVYNSCSLWFTYGHNMVSSFKWFSIYTLIIGFVGFQWAEDGTALSLWVTFCSNSVEYKNIFPCNNGNIVTDSNRYIPRKIWLLQRLAHCTLYNLFYF